MDIDSNYGQGSIDNYIEDNKIHVSKRTSKASVILKNGVLYVQFKGALANRLVTRFFPENESLVEWRNQMYMKYQGDLIQCYHPVNLRSQSECRIAVPINPPKQQQLKKQPPKLDLG